MDPDEQLVYTEKENYPYDELIIATGPKEFRHCAGIREHAMYIGTPTGAMKTRGEDGRVHQNPGPIVIGATQNAGCMGAAYEFLQRGKMAA